LAAEPDCVSGSYVGRQPGSRERRSRAAYVEKATAAAAAADVASFLAAVDPIVIAQRHIYILAMPTVAPHCG